MTCQILNFWQDACSLFVFKFTGVSGEWNKSKERMLKKQQRWKIQCYLFEDILFDYIEHLKYSMNFQLMSWAKFSDAKLLSRINLKNIQATPPAQLQKNKGPNQKMGQRTKQTLLQGRHTDG